MNSIELVVPCLDEVCDELLTGVRTPIINVKVLTARMELDIALERERESSRCFMLSLRGPTPTGVTSGADLGLLAFEARVATDKARQRLDGLLREALPVGEDFQRRYREWVKRQTSPGASGLMP